MAIDRELELLRKIESLVIERNELRSEVERWKQNEKLQMERAIKAETEANKWEEDYHNECLNHAITQRQSVGD